MLRTYLLACFTLLLACATGCQCPSCAVPKWMSPAGCTTCSAHASSPIPPPAGR